MKAFAIIALSLSLEAGFLWQISVIARPERPRVTVMAVAHERAIEASAAPDASVAQYDAPVVPRS